MKYPNFSIVSNNAPEAQTILITGINEKGERVTEEVVIQGSAPVKTKHVYRTWTWRVIK